MASGANTDRTSLLRCQERGPLELHDGHGAHGEVSPDDQPRHSAQAIRPLRLLVACSVAQLLGQRIERAAQLA